MKLRSSTFTTLETYKFLQGSLRRRLTEIDPIRLAVLLDDETHSIQNIIGKFSKEEVLKSPEWACLWAIHARHKRWPEAEPIIATSPLWAYSYASNILVNYQKAPFPEGEPAIATESYPAYCYARDVLRGPFPLGEPAIATDASASYMYARHWKKAPFPLGEPTIAADPHYAEIYAREVLGNSDPYAWGLRYLAEHNS